MTTFHSDAECVNGVSTISIVADKGTDEGVSRVTLTIGTGTPFDLPKITAGQVVYVMHDHSNTSHGFVHVHGQYYGLDGAKRNVSDQDVAVADITACVPVTTTTVPATTTTKPAVTTTIPGATTTTAVVTVPTTSPASLPPTGGNTAPALTGIGLALVGIAAVITTKVRLARTR